MNQPGGERSIDAITVGLRHRGDTPVSTLKISLRGREVDLADFGAVYCIGSPRSQNVKIGWSRDPVARVAQLQVAHADPLRLLAWFPGSRRDEWIMHRTFAELHIRGEWFENQENHIVASMAAILERHWPAIEASAA